MSNSMLLVGTRKGLFVLDSDDRRDWSVRGPYCESWPIYHAVLDRDADTIYAAAASEWLGSAIWRSPDLGETWEHSSEGLGYPEEDGGLRLSKVSHVMPVHGRLLVGAESAGLFESTDGGKTFSLLTTFEGQEGREAWNDPAQQPPGHLGLSAIIPHPDEKDRFWVIVQGFSLFETNDGGQTWEPRNKGLRRDWPADKAAVWRTRDAGSSWEQLGDGLPSENAYVGVLRDGMAIDKQDEPGLYFGTSTGQLYASTDEGESWSQIGGLFPGITSVTVASVD